MIEHVKTGEAVKAETINYLMDAVQGPGAAGDGIGYSQTAYGPLYYNQYSYDVDPTENPPVFLQCKWGWSPSLSTQTLWINMGRDTASAKTLIRHRGQLVKDIGFYDLPSGKFQKLSSTMYDVQNGADNVYDGFVDTQISSLEDGTTETCGRLYAYICEGTTYAGQLQPTAGNQNHYCVITNSPTFGQCAQAAQQGFNEQNPLSCEDIGVTVAMVTPSGKNDPASGQDYGAILQQGHTGYIDLGEDIRFVQFQLTGFIETSSYMEEGSNDPKNLYRARICWWNWYQMLPTAAGNISDSPVKWNSEPIFPFATYHFGWNELSVTDWYESIPAFHQDYYLRVRVTANPYIPKYSTGGEGEIYIYNYQRNTGWNITSAYIPPGGEDHENETHIAQQNGHMGYNTVRAQYQLGTVYIGGSSSTTMQVQSGAMNFMQFDWTHPPLEEAGPGIEGWFKPDSEISDSQTSSIERDTYTYKVSVELSDGTWEEHEEEGYYFRLFNFKYGGDSSEQPLLSCVLSNDWVTNEDCKILVRQEGEHGIGQRGNAILKYARLSVAVPDLSVDSFVENTGLYSVDLSSTNKGHGIIGLHGFGNDGRNANIHINETSSATPDNMQVLVREADDDGVMTLKYARLQVDVGDSSGSQNALTDLSAQLSTDSETPEAHLSSLARGSRTIKVQHKNLSGEMEEVEIEAKYYKMYQFESDEALEKTQEDQSKYTVLVKKTEDGDKVLHYMALSSFEDQISCDSEIEEMDQYSIEKAGEDGKTLQLYNFDSQAADLTVIVSRDQNDTEEDSHILVRDFEDSAGGELRYATLSVDFGRSISVDTEFDNDTKSIDAYGDDNQKIRLHNFDSSGSDVELKFNHDNQTGTEDGWQFLVRNDRELKYATLSIGIPEDLSSKVDELSNDIDALSAMQKPDSEVPELNLSSIERRNWTEDGKNYKAYSFYDFHDNNAHVSKDELEETTTQVLVRASDNGGKVLKYVDLSSFAGGAGDISVDTDIEDLQQYSLERIWDEDLSANYYQLYQFEDNDRGITLSIDNENKELPDDYWILVRRVDEDGNMMLDYANLSVNVSSEVSCDSDGTTNKKSISKNSKGELQIYDFENATTDLTAAFENAGKLNDDVQVLVRYQNEIHYANLSVAAGGAISTDTEYSDTSKSIEQQSDGIVKINGWDTKENKSVSDVSSYADDYDVLMRHQVNGEYQTEYINIAPLLSGGGGETKRKVRKNWEWPTDLSGNYIAPGASGATMYGYYQYGYGFQSYSGTIPSQPSDKTLLCLSGDYSKTSTGYPTNVRLVWTSSYPYANLSSFGVPLYARYNSPDGGPTMDYNAGYFVIPTFY